MSDVIKTVGEIITALRDGFVNISKNQIFLPKHGKNIIEKSEDNTMYMPVIFSTGNIAPTTLDFLPRVLDERYATIISLAIRTDDIIDIDLSSQEAKSNFVKRFHTNLRVDMPRVEAMMQPASEIKELNVKVLNDTYQYDKLFNIYNKDVLTEASKRSVNVGEKSGIVGLKNLEDPMLDQKVKKINALTPSVVRIPVVYRDIKTEKLYETTIEIGVKTVFHGVPSELMIDNVGNSLVKRGMFFKFLQWTRGEIKFFRDILLDYDDIQHSVSLIKKPSGAIWKTLKKYGTRNKLLHVFACEKFIPNASLILSMTEIDELKNKYGVDLMNNDHESRKLMEKLMDTYLFASVYIMDDVEEMMYTYNRNLHRFDIATYKSLKDSTSNTSGKIDIANLLTKI